MTLLHRMIMTNEQLYAESLLKCSSSRMISPNLANLASLRLLSLQRRRLFLRPRHLRLLTLTLIIRPLIAG